MPRIRSEVAWFAQQMEAELRANDHKGGWWDCTDRYLLRRLWQEATELADRINNGCSAETIISEAADVANFAMMIATNAETKELR